MCLRKPCVNREYIQCNTDKVHMRMYSKYSRLHTQEMWMYPKYTCVCERLYFGYINGRTPKDDNCRIVFANEIHFGSSSIHRYQQFSSERFFPFSVSQGHITVVEQK